MEQEGLTPPSPLIDLTVEHHHGGESHVHYLGEPSFAIGLLREIADEMEAALHAGDPDHPVLFYKDGCPNLGEDIPGHHQPGANRGCIYRSAPVPNDFPVNGHTPEREPLRAARGVVSPPGISLPTTGTEDHSGSTYGGTA